MMAGVDPRITFARPDWSAMADEGLLFADMHYHTNNSDSFTDVRKALALAKERRTNLAITDHNLISGVLQAIDLKPDLMVVPGIEISAWDGPHILVYFYSAKDLKSYWERCIRPYIPASPWLAISKDTPWILDSLSGENCVISAAHPMGYLGSNKGVQVCIDKGYLNESIVDGLDAFEVICSGMTRKGNLRASVAASRHGLGYTGGTDGHIMGELGNVVTVSDASDLDGFLDSIKEHKTRVVGMEKAIPMKMLMGAASTCRFMRYVPSSMALHYRQSFGKDSAYRR